jgi:hypothetical protein
VPTASQDDRRADDDALVDPANVDGTNRRQLCPTPLREPLPLDVGKLKPCPAEGCGKRIPRQWAGCTEHEPQWRERLGVPLVMGASE